MSGKQPPCTGLMNAALFLRNPYAKQSGRTMMQLLVVESGGEERGKFTDE